LRLRVDGEMIDTISYVDMTPLDAAAMHAAYVGREVNITEGYGEDLRVLAYATPDLIGAALADAIRQPAGSVFCVETLAGAPHCGALVAYLPEMVDGSPVPPTVSHPVGYHAEAYRAVGVWMLDRVIGALIGAGHTVR
jgi:hypothetical protein